MHKRTEIGVAVVTLLLISIPYAVSIFSNQTQTVFGGFVMNPIDGNSYLAKMYEGWSGSWLFTLPYTAQAGNGTPLFLFYLFLGQLARWIGLPLIWVYHLARILAAVLLVFAMGSFFRRIFLDKPRSFQLALWLSALGTGLGWLAAVSGYLTADWWVAEAYPFLAMYTNPHFPLGIALMLWIFLALISPGGWRNLLRLAVLGLLLSVIMPFGVVIAALVSAVLTVWEWIETRTFQPLRLAALLTGGAPFLLYQFWVTLRDPLLAGWNAQNLTTSPPIWDLIIALSPALLYGLFGFPAAWRRLHEPAIRLLLAWFVLGLVLIYVPFNLQRRFMSGIFVAVAGLAVIGVDAIHATVKKASWVVPTLLILSVPTSLFGLAGGIFGGANHAAEITYTRGEARAMTWIAANTKADALVLSGPEMGSLLPAYTGRRVIYGHPYETVYAVREKAAVRLFFNGEMSRVEEASFLTGRKVDLIFYGPDEQALGRPAILDQLPVVYQEADVTLYEAHP